MFTASFIRKHIFNLPQGTPFSTRDMLAYGVRSAVDQALYLLVKEGTIRRLARGLFVWDPRKKTKFTPFDIARLKAKAFGRKAAIYDFGRTNFLETDGHKADLTLIWTNSRSTKFWSEAGFIELKECAQRKMRMLQTKAGQRMKALWQLGKKEVSPYVIERITLDFLRSDRQDRKLLSRWMPAWLNDKFIQDGHWPGDFMLCAGL